MSQVVSQTSSRCVADKPQTCCRHFAVTCRRQGEGDSFVRHFDPVYSVRSFQMTQGCLRQQPASIHIEKNSRRSSKRARKHRRQTGKVELNSTFPVCWRQEPRQPIQRSNVYICRRVSPVATATLSQARRRHICGICELGCRKLGKVELNSTFPAPGTSCRRVIPDAGTECFH